MRRLIVIVSHMWHVLSWRLRTRDPYVGRHRPTPPQPAISDERAAGGGW